MKSLIISDIHGNLEYTRKIDKICEKEIFDKIIILGDFLYNYYYYDEDEEKEIIAILNKRAKITTAVIGNCDRHYELERFNFLVENEIDKIDLDDNVFIPVIFINDDKSGDNKRFTIGHELGHLVMHLREDVYSMDEKDMDKEADAFSSEFNMPEQE